MSDLQQKFEASVNYVQRDDSTLSPSNTVKLEMYALFKQATAGDVSGDKPSMTDFVKRAKYCAWEECNGLSADQAMQRYIERIEGLKAGS